MRRFLLALSLSLALPASASAGILDSAGTEYVFTATAGEINNIAVGVGADAGKVRIQDSSNAITISPAAAAAGCAAVGSAQTVDCPRAGITRTRFDVGDQTDSVSASDAISLRALMGPGDDYAALNGSGSDVVDGQDGNDVLGLGAGTDEAIGGPGDDRLSAGAYVFIGSGTPGADGAGDVFRGGPGIDVMSFYNGTMAPIQLSPDDVANDGPAGEGDNVMSDVEDLDQYIPPSFISPAGNYQSYASDVYRGTAEINSIAGGAGGDDIDPGANNDVVSAGPGADTVRARDGYADRIICGADADVAIVDQFDQLSDSCESVNRATVANAGDVPENAPPTVAWTAPASGATLSTATANVLSVNASDDAAGLRVQFLAGDRLLCTDDAAPFTCAYSPTDLDIGQAVLTAIAIDAAQQTASAIRVAKVPRFLPSALSASSKPKRDAKSPYTFTTSGKLTLPAGVAAARGCNGTVAVQIKAGKKTVSTRRVELKSTCAYSSKVTFRLPSRLKPKTLRVFVTYRGNAVLLEKAAKVYSVKVS
jgi:Ca2+-binding RTX toxin-like protein